MGPKWYYRDLIGGESGPDVETLQRLLLAPATGVYDGYTISYVRGVQKAHGMETSGILNATVAGLIGESVEAELPPDWYKRTLKVGCQGDDVRKLHELLHLPFGDTYTDESRKAVLRFQSAHRMPLTGRVNKKMANLL